jgi:hypothetical protein
MTTTSTLRSAAARNAALDPVPVQRRTPGIRPARPLRTPAAAAACPIEVRALRSGARALADALTGIALDAPCDRHRQRAVRDLVRLVLGGVRTAADRFGSADVTAAAVRVRQALPTFLHDVSAGAPSLALACIALADRLDEEAAVAPTHDHGPRACPLLRERVTTGLAAGTVVSWLLDAASPAERSALVREGSWRLRWALRVREDRYLRTVDLVRG